MDERKVLSHRHAANVFQVMGGEGIPTEPELILGFAGYVLDDERL